MGSTFHSNVRSPLTFSSIVFLMSGLASVLAVAPAVCGGKRKRAAPVIRQYSDSTGFVFATGTEDMEALALYHWPDNVRELQNLMERSVILSSGPVLHLSLPYPILTSRNATPKVRTLAEAEREHILQALQDNDWIIGGRDGASAQLGVKRTTLLDKMRRHGISRPKPDGLLSAI